MVTSTECANGSGASRSWRPFESRTVSTVPSSGSSARVGPATINAAASNRPARLILRSFRCGFDRSAKTDEAHGGALSSGLEVHDVESGGDRATVVVLPVPCHRQSKPARYHARPQLAYP